MERLLLLGVLMFGSICISATYEVEDCDYISQNGLKKTLQCPSDCTGTPGSSVRWCVASDVNNTNVDNWSICYYGSAKNITGSPPNRIRSAQPAESGELTITFDDIPPSLTQLMFNCTVFDSNEDVCDSGNFTFRIFIDNDPDRILASPSGTQTLTNGVMDVQCVDGRTNGSNGTVNWHKGGSIIPAENITGLTNCDECRCQQEILSRVNNVLESSGENRNRFAFYVLGWRFEGASPSDEDCLIPNTFVSIYVVRRVTPEDEGNYGFSFSKADGARVDGSVSFNIRTVYTNHNTEFHSPSNQEITFSADSDDYLLCNATTSHSTTLHWENALTGGEIPPLRNYSELANKSALGSLCSETTLQVFSVLMGQREIQRASDSATVFLQQVALVFCSVNRNNEGHYVCETDSGRQSDIVSVTVIPNSSPTDSPTDDSTDSNSSSANNSIPVTVTAIIVVIIIIVILALLIGITTCAIMRHRPKSRPHYMDPILFPLSPLAPSLPHGFLLPRVEDPMEFPREQLEFLEVLGEGQFGQVWKALAAGICPDRNRNIVAVKTLKTVARPSDNDDLRSELEIMRHMEPHPNILNFLGQCSEGGGKPLCILMEFAMFGSLKHYLTECKNSPPPPLQPSNPLPHDPSFTSQLSLCSYHNQQYSVDPTTVAQTRRLMRLLQSDYFYHSSSSMGYYVKPESSPPPHPLELAPDQYDRLTPKEIVPHYDRLAPLLAGSQCAYRPSLEDCYYRYTPGYSYLPDYYNEGGTMPVIPEEPEGKDETPNSPTSGEEPERKNEAPNSPTSGEYYDQQEESGTKSSPLSPTYSNVPSSEANRESMVSFDGYVYTASSVCAYCNSPLGSPAATNTVASTPLVEEPERSLGDEEDNTGGLMYFDVLDFAVQIARGMEHLEKMKCVHRDLAARNVLIAEGFLLKIGDFGLSRELSEKDYYRKITGGRLPVRWMALESLEERTHTFKSDVWSFGVVLWEIFTYGGLPYGRSPYANGVESLIHYLSLGNRLPKPPGCTDELYSLMQSCWDPDPTVRPSFSQLISTFNGLLSVAHGYLKVDARIPNTAALATGDTAAPEREDVAPAPTTLHTAATRGTVATTALGVLAATSSAIATATAGPSTVAPSGLLPLSVPELEHTETNFPTEHNDSSSATTPDSATRLLPSSDTEYGAVPRPRTHSQTLHKNKDCLETAV